MKKGITVNGKHSYTDFDLEIAERDNPVADANRITESVPYQNGEYDFSNLNGEVTYSTKELSYTFSICELTTEAMEEKKKEVLNWLTGLVDVEIYDDYIPNYYFKGSIKKFKWTEDFGQGELEVIFSVYPFMYALEKSSVTYEVEDVLSVNFNTGSSHKVIPTITSTGDFIISYGSTSLSIGEGTYTDVNFTLDETNSFVFQGTGTITFEWLDEVL